VEAPREILEDATLVAYVIVPDSATFTGRLNLLVDGARLGPVPALAICRPQEAVGLMLLHCDASWEILGVQAWNAPGVTPITSIEAMLEVAERYYSGLKAHWVTVRDA
jgi:hypothetical protein